MAELTLPAPARCFKVLLAMVPPPPLLPVFDGEDNTRSTHTNSSSTASAHAVCWALKARASLVRPLPAGPTGGKTAKAMAATGMATLGAAARS